jgi:hypothetical protein
VGTGDRLADDDVGVVVGLLDAGDGVGLDDDTEEDEGVGDERGVREERGAGEPLDVHAVKAMATRTIAARGIPTKPSRRCG